MDLDGMAEGLLLVLGDLAGGVHPAFQKLQVLESRMVEVHLGEEELDPYWALVPFQALGIVAEVTEAEFPETQKEEPI